MQNVEESLRIASEGISRVEKRRKSKPQTGGARIVTKTSLADAERIAEERARHALYAEKYREQLLEESTSETHEPVNETLPDSKQIPGSASESSIGSETVTEKSEITEDGTRVEKKAENTNETAPQSADFTEEEKDLSKKHIIHLPGLLYLPRVLDKARESLNPEESYDSVDASDPVSDEHESDLPIEERQEYPSITATEGAGEYNASLDFEAEQHPLTVSGSEHSYSAGEEDEEMIRYIKTYGGRTQKMRSRQRQYGEDSTGAQTILTFTTDKIEESVELVRARVSYQIEALKNRHRMAGYSFSVEIMDREASDRRMRKEIDSRIRGLDRAVRSERDACKRYYDVLADKIIGDPKKREKNSAEIASILGRLEYLLSERSRINRQLISLYTDGKGNDIAHYASREMRYAEKEAKRVYKSQRRLAGRLMRMHVPLDLKEKIYDLMNKKISAYATIEYIERGIAKKRYTGADKRSAKAKIKAEKRNIRFYEDDIAHFMKKAEKHDCTHVANIEQGVWVIGTLVIGGIAAVAIFIVGRLYFGWF